MRHDLAPDPPDGDPGDHPPLDAHPAPEQESRAAPIARRLHAAAARALRIAPDRLDPQQPLVALGIDSLAAIDLQHEIESELGRSVPLERLLGGRSLAELAAELLDQPAAPAPDPAPAAPGTYPLSHGQRALWFLQRLAPGSAAYHLASAARVRGDLRTEALWRALRTLVERHDALRTTFAAPDGEPIQRVHARLEPEAAELDAAGWDDRTLDARLVAEAARPFDLAGGPLLRLLVFRRAAREHVLLLVAHHLAADLWSLSVLLSELDALYPAARADRPLAPAPSYAEYAARQAAALAGDDERLWGYWRAQLAGAPPALDLPTDRPRPAIQSYRGAAHAFYIPPDLAARLKALAQSARATLYATLLAAFQALLYGYTGQRDLVIGSPTAGRSRAETAGMVGYLVNPVALRAALAGDMPFAALVAQARDTALAAFAHQDYPFALLVERIQPERDPGRSPLFQVMFTLQKAHLLDDAGLSAFALGLGGARMRVGGLDLEALALSQQPAPFDLALLLAEAGGGLSGALQYNADLFDATTIQRMTGHLRALLAGVAADPARSIGRIALLGSAERHQLLVEWGAPPAGDSGAEARAYAPVHELFERQAQATPDAVALSWTNDERRRTRVQGSEFRVQDDLMPVSDPRPLTPEPCQLTYAELNARANQLARHLRALGAGPKDRVAVCMERSPDLVIALLGVLKAGAVYLPIDPAYPAERVRFMLEDSRATALLTNDERRTTNGAASSFVLRPSSFVDLQADWPVIAAQPADNPRIALDPASLAYVIYTSGSTGAPKGVLVEHRSLAGTLRATQRAFGLRPGDAMPWIASAAFDIALFECLSPLLAGATTLIFTRQDALDPARALSLLERATAFHTLPSLMGQIVQAIRERPARRYDRMRLVFVGGDAVPPELLGGLRAAFPRASVHVLYGPTEAAILAAQHTARAGDPARWPIGRPLAGARIYLLDAQLRPVPLGAAGEIHIGGPGVARGYLGRPDLTAARFMPNPFVMGSGAQGPGSDADPRSPIPDPRLYRTGDLARWRAGGSLEFLGRIDQQVKLRGFRVEPDEIAATLKSHPDVRDAVVVARADAPGDVRLVAYVVPRQGSGVRGQGSGTATVEDLIPDPRSLIPGLRDWIRARLPDYMIPAFVLVDGLPLTPHGKIDRRALPDPRPQADPTRARPMPRTAVERAIAGVWRDVLRVEQAGLDDNFFDLGGHSLLIVQAQRGLREALGREIPIVALFAHPTIRALAAHLHHDQGGAADGVAAPGDDARTRRAARRTAGDRPLDIAIIGMAGRFPGAPNVAAFWKNLCEGVESITFFSDADLADAGIMPGAIGDPRYVKARAVLEDADQFDAGLFGYAPREAASLDPQQRVFLECAWEALESAGYASERAGGAVGVFAGASMSNYLALQLAARPDLAETLGPFQLMLLNDKDHLATRTSYKLNLSGPSVTVQTACSTSLVAVHLACRSLRDGECAMALAGGVSVRLPQREGFWYQEGGALSPDGRCRAFDAAARGTAIGAGAGVVVLKPLADARADGDQVYAVIKGSAINNDGAHKVGYTAPSVDRQAAVIAEALAAAEVDPATIGYVEAHGTGTELGDPIEVAALNRAFAGAARPGTCAIGSLKPNIGHLDAAAGIAGLIKAALALHHRRIPPSLHFERPNPQIDFAGGPFYVNTTLAEWRADGPRRAGVSSFGMGGTNAHVVLEQAPSRADSGAARAWQIMPIAAMSAPALDAATDRLAAHLRAHPDESLADIAYTLQVGRRTFGHRRALVCRDRDDALAALEARDPARLLARSGTQPDRPVAFLLPGQGSQHPGMARELYATEPAFRAEIDRCCELLRPRLGLDLREMLWGGGREREDSALPQTPAPEAGESLDQTQYAQPALFVVEYALARLWMRWGIQPHALIGHSLGEITAATIAGVFALEDALDLVAARGRIMQEQPGGAMLSVALPEAEIAPRMGADLALAAVNAPGLCVVSGPRGAVAALHERLRAEGVECRPLHTSHAFHSPAMDPVVAPLADLVGRMELRAPRIPFVSNVTGAWISDAQATDPRYWARHLRAPVRFAEGIGALMAEPDLILLEVGPGEALGALARQQPGGSARVVVASLPHPRAPQPDAAFTMGALARLWLAGATVDWDGFHRDERRRRVALPTYPFERQRYWVDPPQGAPAAPRPEAGRKRPIADWFYTPVWRQALPPRPSNTRDPGERWLVFAGDAGIGARLAERLARDGRRVTVARAGARFARRDGAEYVIDPRAPGDYDALLDELRALGGIPDRILHCWSAQPDDDAPESVERFERAQQTGCYSLVLLAQSLARQRTTDPLRIYVVARGLWAVESGDTALPEQATLMGPCRVIPQEYPWIGCHCVDVGPTAPGSRAEELLAEQLLAEFGATDPEPLAAYRGRQRWALRYEPLRMDAAPDPLCESGAYLVVGGASGPGLAAARALAQSGRARMALIGPPGMPPREEWARRLAERGPQSEVGRAIQAAQTLESDGAEVLAIGADAADEAQIRRAVELAQARLGPICGVVCAADESDLDAFRLIAESDIAEFQRQFRLRAHGLYALERALADQPLDFCALAGSLSSALGGLGLCAYTAANLFVDAFAQRHNRSAAVPWISVDWDIWRRAGDDAANAPDLGALAITPDEGAECFRRILAGAAGLTPQVLVSTSELEARLAQWVSRAPAPARPAAEAHARPALDSAFVAPEGEAEQRVAEIWQDLLGVAPIGAHDNFFALGGHSLLGTQLITRVREAFEIDLPLRALFEAPTIAQMALLIEALLIEQLEALADAED